jgi:hypothetical protein
MCGEHVGGMVVGTEGRHTCGPQASSSDPVARQPFSGAQSTSPSHAYGWCSPHLLSRVC